MPVACKEAVALSRAYSGDERNSHRHVNGILASYARGASAASRRLDRVAVNPEPALGCTVCSISPTKSGASCFDLFRMMVFWSANFL